MKTKWVPFAVLSVVLLALLGVEEKHRDDAKYIRINEVCSKNIRSLETEEGDCPDWLEIYNAGETSVSLAGYGLTDDRDDTDKFRFGNVTLKAHEYLIVYLTNEAPSEESEGIYCDFQISSTGETVYLVGVDGKILDQVEVPEMSADLSYARAVDGEETWQKQQVTPGSSNNDMGEYFAPGEKNSDKPVFSVESGFYEDAFWVELKTEGDRDIYYTLDGSTPTLQSLKYEEGIWIGDASANDNVYSMRTDVSALCYSDEEWALPDEKVDKATVLRAVSYDQEQNPSETVTATYFVGYQEKEEYEDICVISVVTEPEELFGYESGIYVTGKAYEESEKNKEIDGWMWKEANYRITGRKSERETHIELFDENKNRILVKDCGIRIKGQGTRAFLQKSFNLYAREEYDGEMSFGDELWQDGTESEVITLFSGGDDEVSRMKDYLAAGLAERLNFTTMQFRPCAVFLDGEYWGMYYLTEKYDAGYISSHYGVAKEDVVIVKNWLIEEGVEAVDLTKYKQDMDYIASADLTVESNYQSVNEIIDIDSYIDYYAFQVYIARFGDWPNTNIGAWKSRTVSDTEYGDGKWRWMLFDVNSGAMENSGWNSFEQLYEDDPVFTNLMTNEQFYDKFMRRLEELRTQLFEPEKMRQMITEIAQHSRPQILKTYDRFYAGIKGEEDYDRAVRELIAFFEERYEVIKNKFDFPLK